MESAGPKSPLLACGRRLASAPVLLVVVLIAALLTPAQALGAQDAQTIEPRHPTEPGAPFRPDLDRSNVVVARAEILGALDEIDVAERALSGRQDVDRTVQILESQRATYERALEELAPRLDELAELTEPYGIEVGAFPVDELRKMFWDDWHQPRSGGRRHLGTDMLAQIGVPLRAIEDGVFERYSGGGLGGLSVYLKGDSGARYFYTHLESAEEFVEGERIYAGELIATNGDDGNARGVPHLHLQIAPDGESGWENPFPLLDALWGEGVSSPIVEPEPSPATFGAS